MNLIEFQATNSKFYRGYTLREKINFSQSQIDKSKFNADLAQSKLQKWQLQFPFNEDSFFAKMLATNGITETDFLYLLSESVETIEILFSNQPTWLSAFEQAFSLPTPNNILTDLIANSKLESVTLEFLYAIEPLLNQALEKFNVDIQSIINIHSHTPFDIKNIESIFFASLSRQLMKILSRTMVLELNVARLQGLLQDESPEERFQSFIERLKQRDVALALFQEYPVLTRQITICIDYWLKSSLEFIEHLCADWTSICTTFSPDNNLGLLVNLEIGAGDSHRQGRSVIIAQFESGLKLVYKPKNLSVDLHFQQFLNWVNECSEDLQFKTFKILNLKTHGWVEFIDAKDCSTSVEIEQFYQRQGGYLALFYALEATDFHSENLIASGEYPMMIDLEALFHPYVSQSKDKESEMLAGSQMAYSVLRVGLLPQKVWANDESEGVDISGLGAFPGQVTPKGVPTWEGKGTDEMRLIRKRIEIPVNQNRPTLNGDEVNVLDYAESIITGFTKIYQLLLKHRDELLSVDSHLNEFANDEVRVVLRSTETYARILWESFHPNLLRDALDRERFFARLWMGVKYRPELEKVILAELQDLWNNEIPIFTTRPISCDLWTSTNQVIPNFFMQSGIDLVKQRLQKLEQQDLKRQIWFIRASLATLVMGDRSQEKYINRIVDSDFCIRDSHQESLRQRLIENAAAIADYLATLVIRGEDDATWLGLNLIRDKQWSVLPLEIDLYDGLSGVTLFLAYLGKITQENRYKLLAEVAFNSIQRQLQHPDLMRSIGGFSGIGGIIYTLSHLGVLWNNSELLSQAEALVELLPNLIAEDEQLDIIAGTAGCIGSLISLYICKPSQKILTVAMQCGDRLLSQAQPMKQGVGWLLKKMGSEPLSGFSHGAAGIAWALLELAALTGKHDFYQAALDGITYERSLFYPELSNWLDLREPQTKDKSNQHYCMTAWCHGAPGIGLARLRSLPYIDDLAIRAEINTAIKTTLEQGFGFNHSLCHGDLGNLELILQASSILQDDQYRIQLDRLTTRILDSIDQQGWLCGVPLRVETPGLMTGLAGIGYGLLRLAEPDKIPSVLVLEPPKL